VTVAGDVSYSASPLPDVDALVCLIVERDAVEPSYAAQLGETEGGGDLPQTQLGPMERPRMNPTSSSPSSSSLTS
jgi:hypothetical protein